MFALTENSNADWDKIERELDMEVERYVRLMEISEQKKAFFGKFFGIVRFSSYPDKSSKIGFLCNDQLIIFP